MDGMFLPILIAVVVILLVFSLWQVVKVMTDPDRRKLKERLSTEGPRSGGGDSGQPLSITMDREATGLSGQLTKLGPLQGLYRQILQAWPDLSLTAFLCICLGLAVVFFFLAFAIVGAMVVALVAAAIGGYIPFILLSREALQAPAHDVRPVARCARFSLPYSQSRPLAQHRLADDVRRTAQAAGR